ncbi:hypothetical protein L21SP5_03231 [Salinivirga cyanobacteriivorans]|uniref:DUF2007 domain-containing protein n=1 Tax=Salinivirga cyanobacteriivorans TaxID=1307839 RepID=A0A0S2I3W2_9BACT|nr:DUF2007 domain-containing protein [Salinivirga cyanobacteriivorans]ALO16845.1 hypothetical protein L21SP5_03231 [Salinivirga cyanobacteriivorans]
MNALITVFFSNTPIGCYILKGRLEEEDIISFVFDEHMVWVHPFRAVAIGGLKLKVPVDTLQKARQILDAIKKGTNGSYKFIPEFEYAFRKEESLKKYLH